jgi:hypothetical protein
MLITLFKLSLGKNDLSSAGKEFAKVWQLVSIGRNDTTIINEEPFNEPIVSMPALFHYVEVVLYPLLLLEVANAEFGKLIKALKVGKAILTFAAFDNAFSIDNKPAQIVRSLQSIVKLIVKGRFDIWKYNQSAEEDDNRKNKALTKGVYKPLQIKSTQARLQYNKFHEDATLLGDVASTYAKDPKILWLKGVVHDIRRGRKFYHNANGKPYNLKGDEQCIREAREWAKDDDAGLCCKA